MNYDFRIALTGATSGVGKALYDSWNENSRPIIGFSKPEYDITNVEDREAILRKSLEFNANVFINNAHAKDGQLELVKMFYQAWRWDSDKQIINIGSISTDSPGFMESMVSYIARKTALESMCLQLQKFDHKCRVVLIRFGFIDTPLVKNVLDKNKWSWFSTFETTKIIIDTLCSPFYIRELAIANR